MRSFFTHSLLLILSIIALSACQRSATAGKEGSDDGKLEYAELLRISEHDGYTEVSVGAPADSAKGGSERYILVERDKPLPAGLPKDAKVIRVPLQRMVVYATPHMAALESLGGGEAIAGVADGAYVTRGSTAGRLKSGAVIDVGSSMSPSTEKIMALTPDALMVSLYDGADYRSVDRLGIPLIGMMDQLERHPLGRAEWIRFIGRLVGRGEAADREFEMVKSNYLKLAGEVADEGAHPKVLTETMYEGVWYVPGGASYQARMLQDAGGSYPWSDNGDAGSLNLTYEQVLERAGDADVWLIKGFGPGTMASVIGADSRYSRFRPAVTGNIYYCDSSESPIFEESPFHPELLLKEYIMIFSGDTTRSLRYFSRLR